MKTVWIYVDTARDGDDEQMQVFADQKPPRPGSGRMTRRAWRSNIR
jgi:hypothetical protein